MNFARDFVVIFQWQNPRDGWWLSTGDAEPPGALKLTKFCEISWVNKHLVKTVNWESQKRIFWDLENVRIEGGKKEGRLREK